MSVMDIRGLILTDSPQAADHGQAFPWMPMAMFDVAGMTPLERLGERLRRHGVWPVTVVVEEDSSDRRPGRLPAGMTLRTAIAEHFWRAAESAFNELAENGAECVLLIRLGAYAEVDFSGFIQFHLQGQYRVTQAVGGVGPLEVFCLNASRRNDAASLFRSQLTRCRSECEPFEHSGYLNPLAGPLDLRQFGIDVLTLNTETTPAGTEIRPGIWVMSGASVEKGSRILAPAFIGSSARIRGGAVITRCTAIEHHAQVDCGTVVENSTVLPYSYVGAGLDLAHSVVGMGHIANLRRSVTVEIEDPKLLGQVSTVSGRRLLQAASELPGRIWRGLLGEARPQPQPLPQTRRRPAPALGIAACDTEAAGEFVSQPAVARRYGNQ
jgi:carbonic anhydrase/acetyltransferase-like protein (isoleucine patch superfamily)